MPLRSFSRVACRRALGVLTASAAVCSMWPSLALAKSDAESPADLEQLPLTEGLIRGARFLDENRKHFSSMGSTFDRSITNASASPSRTALQHPQNEVLHIPEQRYVGDVRPMRIIAYFPSVTTDFCIKYWSEIEPRLSWDCYSLWIDLTERVNLLDGLLKLLKTIVRSSVQLLDITTPQEVPFVLERTNLMAHVVGNSLLKKFGLKDRYFVYYRMISKAASPGVPPCYSMLYRSVPQEKVNDMLKLGGFAPLSLDGLRCFMHYQEIVFLPVFGTTDLKDNYQRAKRSGSIFDAANAIRLKKPEGSEKPAGVMMILTSVNDACSKPLYQFVELALARRDISTFVDCIRRNSKQK